MFVDRAQAVKPDFQLTAGNSDALAEICQRLEGVPLALELAAARIPILGLVHMLERVRRDEDLATRNRYVTERHRSLRAAVKWSYDLLPSQIQRFFARLAVFRGGCTADSAGAVCNESLALDYLQDLAECSLLVANPDGDETRFSMLEMVRNHALECLRQSHDESIWRSRHADFFLNVATAARRDGIRADAQTITSYARIDCEHDNILSAHEWCRDTGDHVRGVALFACLGDYWVKRGQLRLGRSLFSKWFDHETNLIDGTLDPQSEANALITAGVLAFHSADLTFAKRSWERARSISHQHDLPHAGLLHNLANIVADEGSLSKARTLYREALGRNRLKGVRSWEGLNLAGLANVARKQGKLKRARILHEECLHIARELNNPYRIAVSLQDLGVLAADIGNYSKSRECYEKMLVVTVASKDRVGEAEALEGLAHTNCVLGDHGPVAEQLVKAMNLTLESDHLHGKWSMLYTAAMVIARRAGELCKSHAKYYGVAASLCGAGNSAKAIQGVHGPDRISERITSEICDLLGDGKFQIAFKSGQAMAFADAIRLAIKIIGPIETSKKC
jgi:tetratricopeptide (TPR) repeat protein